MLLIQQSSFCFRLWTSRSLPFLVVNCRKRYDSGHLEFSDAEECTLVNEVDSYDDRSRSSITQQFEPLCDYSDQRANSSGSVIDISNNENNASAVCVYHHQLTPLKYHHYHRRSTPRPFDRRNYSSIRFDAHRSFEPTMLRNEQLETFKPCTSRTTLHQLTMCHSLKTAEISDLKQNKTCRGQSNQEVLSIM
ncbi:unnamed protein product [Adineta ricciae]|uniref:Uncharacterized protein n=1 Tax=Adineta ricciae TaxID=249248 RepID=A0A815A9Z7_ADIRI|nr:unnamed protein product [Adineta ricciae]CAF1254016.1 unnamed protein product [Adineta ricciae]